MVGSYSIQQILVNQTQTAGQKELNDSTKAMALSSTVVTRQTRKQSLLLQSRMEKRQTFTRSSSFGRLKQFPGYLCSRSCDAFPNALLFLSAALSSIQGYIKHVSVFYKRYGLLLSFIAAVGVLLVQVIGCCIGIVLGRIPPGLVFMLCSLFFMGLVAYKTFSHTEITKNRLGRVRKLKSN